MSQSNLPVCLALLRVSRGWNQDQLSTASGVRPASISSYERGKLTPSIKMLHRLTTAMGYTLSALEIAQGFLETLEAQASIRSVEKSLRAMAQLDPEPGGAENGEGEEAPGALLLARHKEIDHVSIEVGRVATRFTSLFLTLIEPRLGAGGPEGAGREGI